MLDAATVAQQLLRNFNPKRSGDICLVLEPHWFVNDFDGSKVASTQGSPWRYDTYVPIMFAGWNISAKTINRQVETVDIAPTLALLLGTKLPSGSVGKPLTEAMSNLN